MGGDEPGGLGASLADDDGPSPVLLGGQGLAIPGRTLLDRPGFCGGCVVTLRWVSRRGVDRSSASQRWLENSRSCCCGKGYRGCISRPTRRRRPRGRRSPSRIGSRSARACRTCSGPRPRRCRRTSPPGQWRFRSPLPEAGRSRRWTDTATHGRQWCTRPVRLRP